MKEILISVILVIAVAVGAAYTLQAMDWSSANTYKSHNGSVRI